VLPVVGAGTVLGLGLGLLRDTFGNARIFVVTLAFFSLASVLRWLWKQNPTSLVVSIVAWAAGGTAVACIVAYIFAPRSWSGSLLITAGLAAATAVLTVADLDVGLRLGALIAATGLAVPVIWAGIWAFTEGDAPTGVTVISLIGIPVIAGSMAFLSRSPTLAAVALIWSGTAAVFVSAWVFPGTDGQQSATWLAMWAAVIVVGIAILTSHRTLCGVAMIGVAIPLIIQGIEPMPNQLAHLTDDPTAQGLIFNVMVTNFGVAILLSGIARLTGESILSGVAMIVAGFAGIDLGIYFVLGGDSGPVALMGAAGIGLGIVLIGVGIRAIVRAQSGWFAAARRRLTAPRNGSAQNR
jgi:hypothetical protein